MILLDLFLTFLTIGAVSFGGGYGMISLIRESVVHHGWLTEEAFMSFVAVSEATPGPLAVNMATFVGSSQAGIPGALAATIGVVLPSFLIILLIAAVISNLLKYRGIQAALSGILSTAITLGLKTLLGFSGVGGGFALNIRGLIIFAILICIGLIRHLRGKSAPSPILMILLSAGLGIVFYSFM